VTETATDVSVDGEVSQRLRDAGTVYLTLGRISRQLRRHGDPGTLSPGSVSALATLTRDGPMRLVDLAAAERVSPPTMSRVVAALDRAGFVIRTPDPDDGRAQLLSVNDVGRAVTIGLSSERISRVAVVLDRLDDDDREALQRGLTAFEAALDE